MSINLEGLSAKELQALITQASQRRKTLAKRKPIGAVRKKLAAMARADGYTIAELFGSAPKAREKAAASAADRKAPVRKSTARKSAQKGSKIEPKYRNPANAAETWAGRGMSPKWLSAELAKGRKLEDFLITR